jgi:hypothetical protein
VRQKCLLIYLQKSPLLYVLKTMKLAEVFGIFEAG